jgi:predicted extracellular nuclease
VQGSAEHSALEGELVVVEGLVVGDFREAPIHGLFVQEDPSDQDADPTSSEGIFVFLDGSAALAPRFMPGDRVRLRGRVAEWNDLTEITAVSDLLVCPKSVPEAPHTLELPVPSTTYLERFEGMLVTIPRTLTVTGNFELGRYGSLDLSSAGRLYAPTQLVMPGAAALSLQHEHDCSRVVLDDASDMQDPAPVPYLDGEHTRRLGDTLDGLTGIVDGRYGVYRVQPTQTPSFRPPAPRPPYQRVGRLQIASMNVLNYFTTLDDGRAHCGPQGNLDCRGANSPRELDRQRTKLVTALAALDADVVGLLEVENDQGAATADLVDALNARLASATYAFIETGSLGYDAIKVAVLYKPAKVAPCGAHALLTSAVDPRFSDTHHRPVLAQAFEERASGARFNFVLAHLKSKASSCDDIGDSDLGDGQGACNRTRTAAAQAIADWIASDPTHSGDPDVLLLGDLNSYAREDPIRALEAAGLVSVVDAWIGRSAYSYQFGAQSGYLDHAFATPALSTQVSGASEWHIDCDEPAFIDYNTEWKSDDQFDPALPFRASDHDPLVVGLDLGTQQPPPLVARLALFQQRLRRALSQMFGAGQPALQP